MTFGRSVESLSAMVHVISWTMLSSQIVRSLSACAIADSALERSRRQVSNSSSIGARSWNNPGRRASACAADHLPRTVRRFQHATIVLRDHPAGTSTRTS